VCDLETSRMGAPYIYDISRLRVNNWRNCPRCFKVLILESAWKAWRQFWVGLQFLRI